MIQLESAGQRMAKRVGTRPVPEEAVVIVSFVARSW
jgi:hypothetical protein